MIICDFCSSTPVTWSYPAKTHESFAMEGLRGESVGDWAACDICHEYIESDNWQALLDRSCATFVLQHPNISDRFLREDLKSFHNLFRMHRTGPAVQEKGD